MGAPPAGAVAGRSSSSGATDSSRGRGRACEAPGAGRGALPPGRGRLGRARPGGEDVGGLGVGDRGGEREGEELQGEGKGSGHAGILSYKPSAYVMHRSALGPERETINQEVFTLESLIPA